MKPTSVLGRPVELLQIGPNGWTEQMEANPRDRAEIARTYGLSEVRSLTAEVTVSRVAGGAFAVDGRVAATIVQPCVVTLEPVEQSFAEPIALQLVEEGSPLAPPPPKPGSETLVDDGPGADVISGSVVDLGAIVLEHFALGIDPYPRAPGAALPPEVADPDASADSPFAVLAGLSKPPS